MADDDIYGSKRKYERFKAELHLETHPLTRSKGSSRRYTCKNSENLEHYRTLFRHFEARDLSFIRRVRVLQSMKLICYLVHKNLADCSRDDIDQLVASMHKVYLTPTSKVSFIADIKFFWKVLFPERDAKGRIDDTIVPYAVRHLSRRVDRSRQRLRNDKMTLDELEQVITFFGSDLRLQAYLSLAVESLARPQELLYRRIRNVELHDNHARIYLTERGKEGPGLLQCIDSFPYLVRWLEVHPARMNPDAFLFLNTGGKNHFGPLNPININKMLRHACAALKIDKPVTCYSLKRNGVTIRRLRGESDMQIQHAARWKSTKQLQVYDLSNQEEAFQMELESRGLVERSAKADLRPKKCEFCAAIAGLADTLCRQCKRPLDRNFIRREIENKDERIELLTNTVSKLTAQLAQLKEHVLYDLAAEILEKRRQGLRAPHKALVSVGATPERFQEQSPRRH